jgi:hypothetical protein
MGLDWIVWIGWTCTSFWGLTRTDGCAEIWWVAFAAALFVVLCVRETFAEVEDPSVDG